MNKYLFISLILSVCIINHRAFGQSDKIEQLENQLSSLKVIDSSYILALNELSFEYLKSKPDVANYLIERSLILSDSIGFQRGYIRAIINKGSSFWLSGLYENALKSYLEALKLSSSSPDNLNIFILYNNLGELYKKINEFDSAETYLFRSLNIAEKYLPEVERSLVYSNIAELSLSQGDTVQSEKYFHIAIETANIEGNQRAKAYALFGLGELAFLKNDFTFSRKLHDEALSIRLLIDEKRGIITSLHKMYFFYIKEGRYEEAKELLNNSMSSARQIKAYDLILENLRLFSDYYSVIQNYRYSIDYLNQYGLLKDSLNQANNLKTFEYMKSAFESEIRYKENELLKTQNLQTQNKLRLQIIVIISLVLLLGFLTSFLYQYYKRIKQIKSTNQELDNLNKQILDKNRQIEEINSNLDLQVKQKTLELQTSNESLKESKSRLQKTLKNTEIIAEELTQSNRLLQESQRIAKLGSWDYDPERDKMTWSHEIYSLFEIVPNSIAPSLIALKSHLIDVNLTQFNQGIDLALTRNEVNEYEFRIKTTNHHEKVLLFKIMPDTTMGQTNKLHGTILDITDRKKLEIREKQLIQSLLKFSQIANLKEYNFEKFIEIILKESSQILSVSRSSFWFYDEKLKRIVCFKLLDNRKEKFEEGIVLNEDDYPAYFNALKTGRSIAAHDAINDPATKEFSSTYLKTNGIQSLLDSQVRLQGKMVGIICFEHAEYLRSWSFSTQRYVASLADIISTAISTHENKKLQLEKELLIKKLLKQNQDLEEFAYIISHNLRSPVARILGLIQLLKLQKNASLEESEIFNHLILASNNMDQVIKDLSSVLNARDSEKNGFQEISILESVKLVEESLHEGILESEATINYHFDRDMKIYVQKSSLHNILYNLISNSIKYRSEKRKLEIDIVAVKLSGNVQIQIIDNGLGIDLKKYNTRIFKMYQRFHAGLEGKGLGLFLVKSQIESLNGSIQVESTVNKGTTFKISIPNNEEKLVNPLAISLE